MLISKDNKGSITGWRETYISEREVVDVSVIGNINTAMTRDRTTGRVETRTVFGKPLLPSAFDAAKNGR